MRTFTLLVNPHGGKKLGLQLLSKIRPALESRGLTLNVIETTHAGHAKEIAHTLDVDGIEGLLAIGGDGTLHEIINGMMTRTDGRSLPIGMIAGGSGNAFLLDLDLLDPHKAVNAICKGQTRPIDVARVTANKRVIYACNIIGWGLVTDIGRWSENLRWLGPVRYTITSLYGCLTAKKRPATLTLDNTEVIDEFIFAIGCVTRYTGKGMLVAPTAKLDDGLIDIVLVRRDASRRDLLNILAGIYSGKHLAHPLVEHHTVSRFSIKPTHNEGLNIDGEMNALTPVHVEMIPKAISAFA